MKHLLALLLLASVASVEKISKACSAPGTYETQVSADIVRVTVPALRPCSAADPFTLLRQDVATGDVVRVQTDCDGEWFVDSCVPPGTYRYGFAEPLAPSTADCVCGPYDYFAEVTVPSSTPHACASLDPVEDAGVPWKDNRVICEPAESCADPTPGGCSSVGSNGAASAGGCSVSSDAPSAPGGGLALVVVGLALAAWRRGSERRDEG